MKTKKSFLSILLACLVLSSALILSSCEGSSGGIAPSNMKGKTMNINSYTIEFSSNTSASIKDYYGERNSCASIEYKKTGATSATLKLNRVDDGYSRMSYNFSLIFASPNEGIYSGTYEVEYYEGDLVVETYGRSFSSDDVHRFTIF